MHYVKAGAPVCCRFAEEKEAPRADELCYAHCKMRYAGTSAGKAH